MRGRDGWSVGDPSVDAGDIGPHSARDGFGNTDTLTNIEGAWGTNSDDVLIGNSADNYFVGLAGNDRIYGGRGTSIPSTMELGIRTASSPASRSICQTRITTKLSEQIVSISANTAYDAFEDIDQVFNIERIEGTHFGDILIGANGGSRLVGRDGDDLLIGTLGFNSFAGGEGTDTYVGSNDTEESDEITFHGEDGGSGVVVNLSDDRSRLRTSTPISVGIRCPGRDVPSARRQSRHRHLWQCRGADEHRGGGRDFLRRHLRRQRRRQFFIGHEGADYYDGGEGIDDIVFVWEDGESGIDVDLALGTGTDTFGNHETLISIEKSAPRCITTTIIGSNVRNRLMGFEGDDDIDGGDGRDLVRYDRDADNFGESAR